MDQNIPRQQKRSWYFSALVIGTSLFLVGGVARALFYPPAHARWLVAFAANELIAERVESAKELLDRARAMSDDIVSDSDYWRLRSELISGKESIVVAEIDALIDDAIKSVPIYASEARRAIIAIQLGGHLYEQKFIKQSIRLQESLFPPADQRLPVYNNSLAYSRSIIKVDLQTALNEINLALTEEPNPMFFDTKAWVLYRLGNYDLALKFSDASIRETYAQWRTQDLATYNRLLPDENFTIQKVSPDSIDAASQDGQKSSSPSSLIPESPSKETPSTQKEKPKQSKKSKRIDMDPTLRDVAVMRYHRACILDALNRTDEAQRDYLWLDRFKITEVDSLY
jgi:tetratricopeptide (TPR) repeat protein